jgi:hypothetical protein
MLFPRGARDDNYGLSAFRTKKPRKEIGRSAVTSSLFRITLYWKRKPISGSSFDWKMLLGQSFFDAFLQRQQPVHGGIEFIFGRGIEMEEFGEGAAEGIGVQGTSGGEFGGWFQDAGNDHGQNQVAMTTGLFIDERVEMQTLQSTEDGGDVAVRAGANDVEGLRERGAEGGGAVEDGAEGVDLSRGPVGEISESTVADLAVLAEGFAEEDGGRGVAVGDGSDVHAYSINQIIIQYNRKLAHYMTTTKTAS